MWVRVAGYRIGVTRVSDHIDIPAPVLVALGVAVLIITSVVLGY